MRDERSFLVWEEALRLVRGRDLGDYAGMFAPDGVVELPFPLPGTARPGGPRGEIRTVRAPVWRTQPEPRPPAAGVEPVTVPGPGSDVLVIEFELKGVEASGMPYRLGYVHVVTVHDGRIAVPAEAAGKHGPVPKKRASQEERNKSLVRRYLEAWSAPSFDGVNRMVSAGCVDHAHPGLTGPEASLATARRLLATTAHPSIGIDTLVGDGDLVAARTTVRHVVRGEALVTSGMTFFLAAGGQIERQWSCHPRVPLPLRAAAPS
jgi:ketosteroid isomerase-like protein